MPRRRSAQALNQRPELDAVKDSLANDETSIRLAHNQLEPNLSLTGFYQSSGLGGNQYNLTTGKLVAPGGFGSSMSQLFGLGYPGYGGTLTLTLPVRNRGDRQHWETRWCRAPTTWTPADRFENRLRMKSATPSTSLKKPGSALSAGTASFDLAQKSLASEQRKFELGAETNFFVLDAQTKLAQAELTCCRRKSITALLWQPSDTPQVICSVHTMCGSSSFQSGSSAARMTIWLQISAQHHS
jgi:outer membrane protein